MTKVLNFLKGSAFGAIVLLAIHLPTVNVEGTDAGVIPTSSFFAPLEVKMPHIATESAKAAPTMTPQPTIMLVGSIQQKKPRVLEVSTVSAVRPTSKPAQPTAVPTEKIQPVFIAAASTVPYDEHFTTYSALYSVDKSLLIQIARCESGFRAGAVNGPYLGLYQYLAETWASTRTAMGLDPDPALRANPEEAIKTSAWKIANGGRGAWPSCGS